MIWLKIAVAAFIFIVIFSKVGASEALDYARQMSPQTIPLVLALLLLQLTLSALRQRRVAELFDSRLVVLASLRITFVGSFFSQTFISVIGGDVSRVWLLVRQGISMGVASCIIIFDRLSGLMAHHLMVLAALPWLLAIFVEPTARFVVIAVAVAGTALSVGLLAAGFLSKNTDLIDWLPTSLGGHRTVRGIIHMISVKRAVFVHPRLAGITMLFSLVIAALNSLIIYVLFRGIGADVSLVDCLILVPLLMELALLPITIGGWGLREAVMILGFGSLGVPQAQALLCSVLFGLCSVAIALIGGVIWLAKRKEIEPSQPADAATLFPETENRDPSSVPTQDIPRRPTADSRRKRTN